MISRETDRSHVAWDIETTGFSWNDKITVCGFWFPAGHATLLLNAESSPSVEGRVFEERLELLTDDLTVRIQVCPDEHDLLESLHDVVFEQFDTEYNRLIAFNADSWQGGFDLPFLRMRCLANDYPWVFEGMQFCDLWDPVKKRINTTCTTYDTTTDVNTLVGSHNIIFKEYSNTALGDSTEYMPYRDNPYDPFDDSGNAVYSYKRGEYMPILKHNLADVQRTWELGEVVRQFVPGKDITTKKL